MKSKISLLIISFVLFISGWVKAQIAPVDKDMVAVGGYDLVGYFADGKAEQGSTEFMFNYNGVKYYFLTEAHEQLFKLTPEKYLPQCDGYCSYAVAALATKVSINPEAFKVIEGRLYLFFNGIMDGKSFNALSKWNEYQEIYLAMLPENWKNLKGTK